MEELGDRIAYLALPVQTPVYCSGGTDVGRVAHVFGDEQQGIFDGLVITQHVGSHRYVDADHVDAIYERGVVLTVSAAEVETLPEPGPETPIIDIDALPGMKEKLKRAWEALSGK